MDIVDQTETNLVALRRSVYLTIQSRYFTKEFFAGFYALRRPYTPKGISLHKFVRASVNEQSSLDVLQSCCNLVATYQPGVIHSSSSSV